MAVAVHLLREPVEQIDLRDPRAEVVYLCKRTDDEAEARVAINANSPAFYYGLPKLSIQMAGLGGGVWEGTVNYGLLTGEGTVTVPGWGGAAGSVPPPPLPPPPNPTEFQSLDESWTASVTGQTERVTQARRREYGDGQVFPIGYPNGVNNGFVKEDVIPRPDLTGPFLPTDGTLGWDERGNVVGTDRQFGYLEVVVTRTFPTVSLAYLQHLRRFAFCVNSGFFFRQTEGTLLFLGANMNPPTPNGTPMTFRFGLAETEFDIVIWEDPDFPIDYSKPKADPANAAAVSKALIVPRKRGWDYLWVEYETVVASNRLVKKPKVAHVEQIFRYVNFDNLGIGSDA